MHPYPRILTALCLSLLLLTAACGNADNPDNLSACKANLQQLGSTLDMWAMDHQGQYPERLEELLPNYLKDEKVLVCPAAGVNTYFAGYQRTIGVAGAPDAYVIGCSGSNHSHQDLAPNFPQFSSEAGLRVR